MTKLLYCLFLIVGMVQAAGPVPAEKGCSPSSLADLRAPYGALKPLSTSAFEALIGKAKAQSSGSLPAYWAQDIPFRSTGRKGTFEGQLQVSVTERGELELKLPGPDAKPLANPLANPLAEMTLVPKGPRHFEIQWMKTYDDGNLEKGIMKELFRVALALFPETETVSAVLEITNRAVYRESLNKGATPREAIEKTPIYLIAAGEFEVDESRSFLPTDKREQPSLVLRRRHAEKKKVGSSSNH